MQNLDDYAWLVSDDAAPWHARVAGDARSDLQLLPALRRDLTAGRAQRLVEQRELRRRAAAKFGDRAATMFFDRVRLEQATDLWIARYKAARLATGVPAVADYCCGIGGDLLAFAESSAAAAGWDVSPAACLLAGANLRGSAPVHFGDVELLTPGADTAWHLDPDRRSAGRRTTAVADYAPGPEVVDRWRAVAPRGAVKLAPAAQAPPAWAADGELEWITRDRECRQQVVWLAAPDGHVGRRRATLVRRDGQVASFVGDAAKECTSAQAPASYVYDPDPSLVAAGLNGAFAAAHGLATLGVGATYLTGEQLLSHPLVAAFRVRDTLPFREGPLARHLAAQGIGQVEIKVRGVAIDPQALTRSLIPRGDNSATLLITRIGKRSLAVVADRMAPEGMPGGPPVNREGLGSA